MIRKWGHIVIVILVVWPCVLLKSQIPILGFNNTHLSESSAINPAFIPQFGNNISIGTTGLGIYFPEFQLSDFFSKGVSVQEGLDSFLSRDYKQLKNIEIDNTVNILHLGFRSQKAFLSLNSAVKTQLLLNIDKDVLGFTYYGNGISGPYFGKRMELDFAGNKGNVVWENRITYGRIITKWLNLGVSLTNYNGLYAYDVRKAKFGITSDTSNAYIYKLLFDAEWDIITTGLNKGTPVGPMDFIGAGPFTNKGQAVGGGIAIRPSRRYRFSASMNNYGGIEWNYFNIKHFQEPKKWQFQGLDTVSFARGNTNDIAANFRDTLESLQTFSAKLYRPYFQKFTPSYYLGFEYFITARNKLSYQYSTGHGFNQNNSFWAIQSQNRIKENFDIMVAYAEYDFLKNPQPMWSVGFSAYYKHYQLFAMVNNVSGLIYPDKTQYHSARIGVNFLFTENVDKDGDDVPDHRDNCKKVYGNARYKGCPDHISSEPYLYDPMYYKMQRLKDISDRFKRGQEKYRHMW